MTKTSVLGEQYVSARATPRLVGHLKARDQIHEAIRDGRRSYLVYIFGPGGIGKTWLIRDILENPPKGVKNILCAEKLIDLYHIRNNSVPGLIDSIFEAFPKFRVFLKQELKKKYAEKFELENEGLPLAELIVQCSLIDFFLQSLNKFRGNRRLVIAIDTAEKLLFALDPVQETLSLQNYIPWVIRWLVQELIPALDNTVIILAGRPEKDNFLRQEFQKINGKTFLPLQLKTLSMEEALNYFDAIIEAARKDGDKDTANYLSAITEPERRKIFAHLSAVYAGQNKDKQGIRPIIVSLAIDYLVTRHCSVDDLIDILKKGDSAEGFEATLIQSFVHDRRPANALILAMALAPKGVDDSLLLYLNEKGFVETKDVKKMLAALKQLSFVKFRPKDKRAFLHDEVLDMISKRLWENQRPHAQQIQQEIVSYYKSLMDENRKKIMDDRLNIRARSEVRWQQIETQVEYLHYLLALESGDILDVYSKYAEQALLSNNEGLDLQLRAELLTYLRKNRNKQ